jgi:hypothetical protein
LTIGGNLNTATYPSVNTVAASAVGITTATLNGNLINKGTASYVNGYFDYGTTTGYGTPTTLQNDMTLGAFSVNITNLAPATTYHFRANAIGGNGTLATGLKKNGGDLTFTTAGVLLITTTNASLPTGKKNKQYGASGGQPTTPVYLAASGGLPSYTWAKVSGPSWMSISSGGQITGTPDNNTTYPFTARVTDSVGNTTTKDLQIVTSPN